MNLLWLLDAILWLALPGLLLALLLAWLFLRLVFFMLFPGRGKQ